MNPALSQRDALWLIVSLVLVAAPHIERLPWWLTLIVAVLAGWRAYLARMRLALPPRALLMAIVGAASVGVYMQYGTLFGRDAGVALLVVMLALKLLEMRTSRDAMLLIFLGYFLVITNFLYSQTIATGLYMLACIWVITGGMIGLHYTQPPPTLAPQMRLAGGMLLQSLPLMLILFVLFPRVEGPLWSMPSDSQRGLTGLSDTMSPGSLSSLTLSEAVAFRVVFRSPMPEQRRLYWRGPILWDYDGRTWRAGPFAMARSRAQLERGVADYTVTVEPHGKPWLFALDLPARAPPGAIMTADRQLIALRPVTTRLRYDMASYLEYSFAREESDAALKRALTLPPGFNPRTLAFARKLREKAGSDRAFMQAIFTMFSRESFRYTLNPPQLGQHTVDEFLFGTKSGFCEHYSSAFTVLMRAAGIPARVVTGYLGGEVNPIGEYLIVRQADAHAWSEVWLPGSGWVRADPTAAVSPARIEQGISAMESAGSLPLLMRSDFPLVRQIRLSWDSAANTWNQWVLGYTSERQRAVLSRVGIDNTDWHTLAPILLAATGTITLLLSILTLRRMRVRVRDPVKLAYAAFCRKLTRRGLPREPAEGPLDYAERVVRARPDLDRIVRAFTALYVRARYGDETNRENVRKLRQLARDFQP
jgi:transglutaminase-like putative cysteine protease